MFSEYFLQNDSVFAPSNIQLHPFLIPHRLKIACTCFALLPYSKEALQLLAVTTVMLFNEPLISFGAVRL
jgi:hypothetical protein